MEIVIVDFTITLLGAEFNTIHFNTSLAPTDPKLIKLHSIEETTKSENCCEKSRIWFFLTLHQNLTNSFVQTEISNNPLKDRLWDHSKGKDPVQITEYICNAGDRGLFKVEDNDWISYQVALHGVYWCYFH